MRLNDCETCKKYEKCEVRKRFERLFVKDLAMFASDDGMLFVTEEQLAKILAGDWR